MSAKALVIVESPAKAKTIKKYLGRSYDVLASVGHIMDLPKSKLGVDVEQRGHRVTQRTQEELALHRRLERGARGRRGAGGPARGGHLHPGPGRPLPGGLGAPRLRPLERARPTPA